METPIREYWLLSLFPECEVSLAKYLFDYNFQIHPSPTHTYGLLEGGYGGLSLRVETREEVFQAHSIY